MEYNFFCNSSRICSRMAVLRTWDILKIANAINTLVKNDPQIDSIEWVANPDNIALENSDGDLALFEHAFRDRPIYSGHYFFKSRGKAAALAAKDFLDELFNSCYNINIVMGLVPTWNKAARWMTRHIGFTSYGFEEIHDKEYELFILTKKEFQNGR